MERRSPSLLLDTGSWPGQHAACCPTGQLRMGASSPRGRTAFPGGPCSAPDSAYSSCPAFLLPPNKPALLQCIAFAHAVMSCLSSIARKALAHPQSPSHMAPPLWWHFPCFPDLVTFPLCSRGTWYAHALQQSLHWAVHCVFVFVAATTKMVTSQMVGINLFLSTSLCSQSTYRRPGVSGRSINVSEWMVGLIAAW